MRKHLAVVVMVLLTLWAGTVSAQEQATPPAAADSQPAAEDTAPRKLVVVTREIPPFIIKDGDSYTGFSADLWRELAERLARRES